MAEQTEISTVDATQLENEAPELEGALEVLSEEPIQTEEPTQDTTPETTTEIAKPEAESQAPDNSDAGQSKPESASQARRRRQKEARERDRAAIEARDKEIERLRAEIAGYQDEDPNKAEDYDTAVTNNAVNRVMKKRAEQALEQATTAKSEAATESLMNAKTRLISEAREDGIADFDTVMSNPELPVTPEMFNAMVEGDISAKTAYQAAKDPAQMARLAAMSPFERINELGRMERQNANVPKAPTQSNAPEPIKPGSGTAKITGKNPDDMNVAEMSAHLGLT